MRHNTHFKKKAVETNVHALAKTSHHSFTNNFMTTHFNISDIDIGLASCNFGNPWGDCGKHRRWQEDRSWAFFLWRSFNKEDDTEVPLKWPLNRKYVVCVDGKCSMIFVFSKCMNHCEQNTRDINMSDTEKKKKTYWPFFDCEWSMCKTLTTRTKNNAYPVRNSSWSK